MDKLLISYKSTPKQHFNCIWMGAEDADVNNLCAQTLTQEGRAHALLTDVSVCMCLGSCNVW